MRIYYCLAVNVRLVEARNLILIFGKYFLVLLDVIKYSYIPLFVFYGATHSLRTIIFIRNRCSFLFLTIRFLELDSPQSNIL